MMRMVTACAIAMLTACASHYSAEDLAGKYVLSVDGGIDTLALNANGTYIDTYTAQSGQVRHQDGTWDLEHLQAGPSVVLNSFRSPFPRDGQKPGFYFLLVERSFGRLYLITNIDLNEGYKKQS